MVKIQLIQIFEEENTHSLQFDVNKFLVTLIGHEITGITSYYGCEKYVCVIAYKTTIRDEER